MLFFFFEVQNNDKQAAPTMEMTWEKGKLEANFAVNFIIRGYQIFLFLFFFAKEELFS